MPYIIRGKLYRPGTYYLSIERNEWTKNKSYATRYVWKDAAEAQMKKTANSAHSNIKSMEIITVRK